MWCSNTDDIIKELFESFLKNFQEKLKIISESEFIFESVDLMDYKLHRVRLRIGGWYIKSLEWLLHKGETINFEKWKWWWMITVVNNFCIKL